MKKLGIIVGLFLVSPIIAMESMQLSKITSEDNKRFIQHFLMAVGGFERKIKEKIYTENNPIYISFRNLRKDLLVQQGDIKMLMASDHDLRERIEKYEVVDSNLVIKRALEQVRNNQGDITKATDLIIQNRRVLAELKLQELQPTYSPSLIGEIDTKERENFVKRNENYPTDEKAVKDYTALFIYLTLLADKVE